MTDRAFTAGLVQMRTGQDVGTNVKNASELIREAAAAGARYVQTPEMTSLLVRDRERLMQLIRDEEHDAALKAFRELASDLKIWLHLGSLPMAFGDGRERVANRAFLISPGGEIVARYDKIHMFDVDLDNGESWRESRTYQPGEAAVVADLPWGGLGMTICYDLRFSTLYRALAEHGAEFIAVPAAFTRQTGEAHWHVLLRARAIETGSFVFAAAQAGQHEDGRETYGHSMIVDPWGEILAEAGIEPDVVTAEIRPERVAQARRKIPVLQNGRRFSVASDEPVRLGEAAR